MLLFVFLVHNDSLLVFNDDGSKGENWELCLLECVFVEFLVEKFWGNTGLWVFIATDTGDGGTIVMNIKVKFCVTFDTVVGPFIYPVWSELAK